MINVYDFIAADDLTEDLIMLADVCGMDVVRQMMQNFAGLSFYVPRVSRLDGFIDRYMQNNQDKSLKAIALELGVSSQFLKNKQTIFQLFFNI